MKTIATKMRHEFEANAFAMALLMPEQLVRNECAKMNGVGLCDDEKIKKIAKLFQVPVALMAIRIGQIYGNHLL